MKYKIFSEQEFDYAIRLLETDPFMAKTRFIEYMNKYPYDYYAQTYYILLLTRLCEFDEAEKEYNRVLTETGNGTSYSNNRKRYEAFIINMALIKVKLLANKENYDELYNFFTENYVLFDKADQDFVDYFCRIKLGMLNDIKDVPINYYRFNQSFNYQEEAFFNHIKRHLAIYNQKADYPNQAIFSFDFPFDIVYQETKKYIPSDRKMFLGYFDNTYYFKYNNCGSINHDSTDYFKIVCFHNTSNYITMYPINNDEHLPYIDLNYLKDNIEIPKTKRLSQIDKFNQKYRR